MNFPVRHAAEMARSERLKAQHREEFQRELALDRFRQERPQLWLQYQRVLKLTGIQDRLQDQVFPRGHCFLHCTTVSQTHFCIRRVTGMDLDTCQVTLEIYGDDELEDGIVVLPMETVEWFGFPANAVPVGIHFQGFTGSAASAVESGADEKSGLSRAPRPVTGADVGTGPVQPTPARGL